MNVRRILLVAFLSSGASFAQTAKPAASALNANFGGDWVGVLEYRDFQTDAQTFLPTWLTMTGSPDGSAITLDYMYDDGPTKTVRERSVFTFTGSSVTISSDRDHSGDAYAVAGLEEFRKLNRGTLTLTGKGTENDKPVDFRIVLTLRRNLYTSRKETRAAGSSDPFRFRDAYTFTRAKPPV